MTTIPGAKATTAYTPSKPGHQHKFVESERVVSGGTIYLHVCACGETKAYDYKRIGQRIK